MKFRLDPRKKGKSRILLQKGQINSEQVKKRGTQEEVQATSEEEVEEQDSTADGSDSNS
jgi:hypothetical protein